MKILIIQERGRHDGNREFREACALQRSLYRQGVDTVIWGLGWNNFSIPFETISSDCDVILLLENYDQTNWVPDLSNVNKLKLFWSIDSHCAMGAHIETCRRNKIDIVLNSIDADRTNFEQNLNIKSYYFPNAYPSDLITPTYVEKTKDVGFCGNMLNRQYWLNQLGIVPDIMKIGQDMIHCINSYKIHWNRNLSHDINYRTFETLGCCTFLLTNHTDRLSDLYEDGKHLVVYDSVDDCKEKIKYYLEHEEERIAIEKAGFEYTINNHSYDKRAELIVDIINKNV